ncbi:vitamin B12-dependent ribonucleotide reductase [Candidatus Kryptobacter tengchongensis]|uniref:Vitamin B12-dependent ribonucleotide reductase n=1 Tax=Kryptobacter tengchongensis TaxID=1643429 RepID=A0A916LJ36_KRYT1|nr:vitamin B12-dependent ribonucleotide reductase [Candidatus Kryptobacter tengchongensis]CUT00055.1 ribonucleoside-diphosphate reductase class II [Candidatus Kryptobacter tengchongensis]
MDEIKKRSVGALGALDEETLSADKSLERGLKFKRFFTKPNVHPFDEIVWEKRDAVITNERGEVVFEQKGVEVPASWSMLATNIVVSKYFHGQVGTPEREYSVKQLIERVARTITNWGIKDGYFAGNEDADVFYNELVYLLVNQYASFNSPVWFNVGVEEKPQASACFINSVQDTMESILELAKTEGMLFKYGSGTGTNFSTLRSSKEKLSGGGVASGPVSFMRGFDAFAGVIKSGGKTRRAAKMVILNVDHPDIIDFIKSKAEEEKKAHILIKAGYDPGFNVPGGAYDSVQFQNANHSVRVTDEFMKAVLEDGEWHTRYVTTGEICDTYKARDIMRMIAEAAWLCGDPGMQFDTTINSWHTCPNTGRINASNPCSEFMFLDDTACNLASLNLMKFRKEDGTFDVKAFCHAVDIMITAQEIIVDNAGYPTKAIERNSHDYRPLGLGYANLGALLMSLGLPYDSEPARAYAAVITAIMTGEAYKQSALIAKEMGPFRGFELNREPMLGVIRKHMSYIDKIDKNFIPKELYETARRVWGEAYELGQKYGYRNSQVTVIAPTGTIGFMMDCDTTGIEPDIALVKYKKLVGGGFLKIVNNTVPLALKKLGYDEKQIKEIVDYIDKNDTIEGAPHLRPEHLPVFDCAFKPAKGQRFIHYMGHVKMMAAVQPFISGAISKTVNMPNDVTVDDVMQLYIDAWKMGLKAIAIYRDGSKWTQPLSTSVDDKKSVSAEEEKKVEFKPVRRRLPDERKSITHKFSVAGHEGYITVGMYPDGTPGEIFITMSKEGSTLSGLMDAFATAISLALQYGVPLKVLVDKFSHMRFEPSGFTNNPDIPIAKSIIDYIFRWLGKKFLTPDEQPSNVDYTDILNGIYSSQVEKVGLRNEAIEKYEKQIFESQSDAPPCPSCGTIMQRAGSCYVCPNCGSTSGCS